MIMVVAKNFIRKEKVKEYQLLAQTLMDATRMEKGSISYELYQDEKNSSIMTMIESWSDQKALEKHLASEHFQRLVPMMNKLTFQETEMNIYHKMF